MGLNIEIEGDLFVPTVTCDHCGERIVRGEEGNYEWRIAKRGEPERPRIHFTHKGCSDAFRRMNARHGVWLWCGLNLLPFQLGNNLSVDWAKVESCPMDEN